MLCRTCGIVYWKWIHKEKEKEVGEYDVGISCVANVPIVFWVDKKTHHYVTDDFFTVLNTYDVFPSSVININNPDNIENFCDEFYTFYGVFDYAKWDAGEYYSNNDNMTETVYEFCNGVNGQFVYTNVVKISIEK